MQTNKRLRNFNKCVFVIYKLDNNLGEYNL